MAGALRPRHFFGVRHGCICWLVYLNRIIGGSVDYFFFRRSIIYILLLGLFGYSASSHASGPPETAYFSSIGDAMSACQAYADYYHRTDGECGIAAATGDNYIISYISTVYSNVGHWYAPKPTPESCASQPSSHFGSTNLSGPSLTCYQGCQYGFTPDPGQVQVCIGGNCTSGNSGTVAPTGQTCSGSSGEATPDYQPPPKPKLCGGGSCYDPGTQQYCAVDASGQQVCVSAPQAAQTGAQASSADSTVTAGNPPPTPSNPPIANPPTDIQSSDTYQQTTMDASGQPMPGTPITVNSYGAHGSTTSSGQSEGDMGPAPPSSTDGSQPGLVSGGLDCNSPPICSGDAVNCAVVSQTWMARCQSHKDLDQLHKDLTDTGDFEKPGPVSQGDVWTDGSAGTGNAIADNALQGHFDESGLGFSTQCPLHDLTVELPGGHSFVIPFTDGCQFGDWIRAVVIAFALFSAAKIVTGGRG